MTPEEIINLLKKNFQQADIVVESEDNHHFNARIISDVFEGQTLITRQRQVYDILGQHIQTGALHALSLKTYTNKEWQQKCEN